MHYEFFFLFFSQIHGCFVGCEASLNGWYWNICLDLVGYWQTPWLAHRFTPAWGEAVHESPDVPSSVAKCPISHKGSVFVCLTTTDGRALHLWLCGSYMLVLLELICQQMYSTFPVHAPTHHSSMEVIMAVAHVLASTCTHTLPTPPTHTQIALKLLDCDFPDENIRGYATRVLRQLPDEKLEDFLLQLTQVHPACSWQAPLV